MTVLWPHFIYIDLLDLIMVFNLSTEEHSNAFHSYILQDYIVGLNLMTKMF